MFNVTLSGHIGSLKTRAGKNGELLIMRVAVKIPRKGQDGSWTDDTLWCEAVASGQGIERWSKFKVGDAIEMTGRGDLDLYVPANGGQPSVTMKLYGLESGTPAVRWTPGSRKPEDGGNGGNGGNGAGRFSNGGGASTDDIPF